MGMRLPTRWIGRMQWPSRRSRGPVPACGPGAVLALPSRQRGGIRRLAGPSGPSSTCAGSWRRRKAHPLHLRHRQEERLLGRPERGRARLWVKAADSASIASRSTIQGGSLHLVVHTASVASSGSVSAGRPMCAGGRVNPRLPRRGCQIHPGDERGGGTPSRRRSAAGGWSGEKAA